MEPTKRPDRLEITHAIDRVEKAYAKAVEPFSDAAALERYVQARLELEDLIDRYGTNKGVTDA